MNIAALSIRQLKQAVAIKQKIAKLEAELASLVGAPAMTAPAPKKRKGTMSEAGRARVAAAQRKRWAKIKAARGK
jgi:hypothetical protein